MKSEQTKQAFSSLFYLKKNQGFYFPKFSLFPNFIISFATLYDSLLLFPLPISQPLFLLHILRQKTSSTEFLFQPQIFISILTAMNDFLVLNCQSLNLPVLGMDLLFYFFTSSFHKLSMLQKTVDYTSSDLRPYSNSVTNFTDIIFFVVCSSAVIQRVPVFPSAFAYALCDL